MSFKSPFSISHIGLGTWAHADPDLLPFSFKKLRLKIILTHWSLDFVRHNVNQTLGNKLGDIWIQAQNVSFKRKCLQDVSYPTGTRRNNSVIMTFRFDIIMTLKSHHVPAGYFVQAFRVNSSAPGRWIWFNIVNIMVAGAQVPGVTKFLFPLTNLARKGLNESISNSYQGQISEIMKSPSGRPHWWLVNRHQAITWTNVWPRSMWGPAQTEL